MYAGHFATALALRTVEPRAPTWALLAGSGVLDLAFGTLVIAGVEGFATDFKTSHLLVIPWSHSLLTAAGLGALFAAAFWRRGAAVVALVFAAVLSHWLLDVMVHRPDMALWPGGALRLGGYSVFGPVSGWGETLVVVGCGLAYALGARRAAGYGRHWRAALAVLALLWLMGLNA